MLTPPTYICFLAPPTGTPRNVAHKLKIAIQVQILEFFAFIAADPKNCLRIVPVTNARLFF